MYTTEKTRNELYKRFQDNGFQPITVKLKFRDIAVTITPCLDAECENRLSMGDLNIIPEFYMMSCDVVYLTGSQDLCRVADTLNNFESIVRDSEEDRAKLQAFWDKNLAGLTPEDWERKELVENYMIHEWKGEPDWMNMLMKYEDLESAMADMGAHPSSGLLAAVNTGAKELGMTADDFVKAALVSSDFGLYSDWYKDEYGHRPRIDVKG